MYFVLKKIFKCILPNFMLNWLKKLNKKIIINVNNKAYDKHCLLVYVTDPFVNGVNNHHQNSWQTIELAKIIGEYGYNVDVVDVFYNKNKFNKKYDLIIDLHPIDFALYYDFLKDNCIKIAYMTGSNTSFSNKMELQRLNDVLKRKHVKLIPRRKSLVISKRIEKYNGVMFIGNKYNLSTFSEFRLPPVYFIKNTGYEFNFSITNKNAKKFLFLASSGQVHKGLDLILEVFKDKCTDCELYVCSGFKGELDFEKAYYEELYKTKNIHAIGFVDIFSDKFKEICEECSYMIMPSCSEGMSGSVLAAMSAGLIPIVSKECGFEEDEVIHLRDCSMECIEENIKFYSSKDIEWIRMQCLKSIRTVEERYSSRNYTDSVKKALDGIIGKNCD